MNLQRFSKSLTELATEGSFSVSMECVSIFITLFALVIFSTGDTSMRVTADRQGRIPGLPLRLSKLEFESLLAFLFTKQTGSLETRELFTRAIGGLDGVLCRLVVRLCRRVVCFRRSGRSCLLSRLSSEGRQSIDKSKIFIVTINTVYYGVVGEVKIGICKIKSLPRSVGCGAEYDWLLEVFGVGLLVLMDSLFVCETRLVMSGDACLHFRLHSGVESYWRSSLGSGMYEAGTDFLKVQLFRTAACNIGEDSGSEESIKIM